MQRLPSFAALLCLATTLPATGQEISASCLESFSTSRITIAVASSAGGGLDTYARAAAPAIERLAGTTVQVANMPGGGGQLAMREALSADGSQITLLVEDGVNLATTTQEGTADSWATAFHALGFFHRDPGVWIGRKDLDLRQSGQGGSLVAGVATIEHERYSIAVPAQALGLTVNYVAGYEASADLVAAVLRDEVDFATMSLSSALRAVQDPELAILLVLGDRPHAQAPDAPHLTGAEGLVTGTTDSAALAQAATALTTVSRGLFVRADLDPPLRDCLDSVIDLALHDPEVKTQAEAQGRPLQPVTGTAAAEVLAQMVAAHTSAGSQTGG